MAVKGFKYDLELFLGDVLNTFQSQLNTKIDAINEEKQNRTPETEDNFDIPNIPTNAWFLNHIPRVWDYPSFVVWGIDDISLTEQQADGAMQTVDMFIEVCIPDNGDVLNEENIFKLLRYSRALQDIALKDFDSIRGHGKTQVDSISPNLVSINGEKLLTAGIILTAQFGIR